MRKRLAIAALGVGLLVSGCGNSEDADTPSACLTGPGTFGQALAAAPDPVRLVDEVRISDCLVENQAAGQLSQVGAALVQVATELKARSEAGTGAGQDALELGYLVGAVRRGAAETGGIHADLVRRVASAAAVGSANAPRTPAFDRAYVRGYAAGQRDG